MVRPRSPTRPHHRRNHSRRRARLLGRGLRAPRLQLGQLALQPLLPLHPREGGVEIVLGDLEERGAPRRLLPDLVFHAPQRDHRGAARHLQRRLAGAGPGPGRPVLRDQELLLALGFALLQLQLPERLPQEIHLAGQVLGLLGEDLGGLPIGVVPLEGPLGQVVLSLLDRQLGLAHPLVGLPVALGRPLLGQVLLGQRDRQLGLHLDVLVVQVQDHLLDHLLRVLGPIDQVVQIGPDQHAHALQELHQRPPLLSPSGVSLSPGVRSALVCTAASRIAGIRAKRSPILTPASVSRSAGACGIMLATSATTLLAPAPPVPLPVETMVILSTLASGSAMARTTSGSPVRSLSITAAWLYSWNAAAFTFMASASDWPLARMISASAVPFIRMTSASAAPWARAASARPAASAERRAFSALARVSMRSRSASACLSTVAASSRSRRRISASCTLICSSRSMRWTRTCSAMTRCCCTEASMS